MDRRIGWRAGLPDLRGGNSVCSIVFSNGSRGGLETLLSVASRAAELFERSKTAQKRELLAFVFSNLRLRDKKLEFTLRSPFDLMVNRADHASWLAFLNTVRTERFREILSMHELLPAFARVA